MYKNKFHGLSIDEDEIKSSPSTATTATVTNVVADIEVLLETLYNDIECVNQDCDIQYRMKFTRGFFKRLDQIKLLSTTQMHEFHVKNLRKLIFNTLKHWP